MPPCERPSPCRGTIQKQTTWRGKKLVIERGQTHTAAQIEAMYADGSMHALFGTHPAILPYEYRELSDLQERYQRFVETASSLIAVGGVPGGAPLKDSRGRLLCPDLAAWQRIAKNAADRLRKCMPPPGVQLWGKSATVDQNGFPVINSHAGTNPNEAFHSGAPSMIKGDNCGADLAVALLVEGTPLYNARIQQRLYPEQKALHGDGWRFERVNSALGWGTESELPKLTQKPLFDIRPTDSSVRCPFVSPETVAAAEVRRFPCVPRPHLTGFRLLDGAAPPPASKVPSVHLARALAAPGAPGEPAAASASRKRAVESSLGAGATAACSSEPQKRSKTTKTTNPYMCTCMAPDQRNRMGRPRHDSQCDRQRFLDGGLTGPVMAGFVARMIGSAKKAGIPDQVAVWKGKKLTWEDPSRKRALKFSGPVADTFQGMQQS
jgi:hypothetical protein